MDAPTVETSYVDSSLELLRKMLAPAEGTADGEDHRAELSALTCGLLSTLADAAASLETLFQLYRQILELPPPRSEAEWFRDEMQKLERRRSHSRPSSDVKLL